MLTSYLEPLLTFSSSLSNPPPPPLLSSSRYLSEEGIAELKGSAEKITTSDIIRIALDVSFESYKFYTHLPV